MSFRAVLAGDYQTMNGFYRNGAPVIVSYAFSSSVDLSGTGYTVADTKLKSSARAAMAVMEQTCGVRFVEVEPGADEMISLFYNDDREGISWAYYPFTSIYWENTSGGIGMNRFYDSYSAGSAGFQIMLHELGHAVGLKHPFDGSPNLPPAQDNTNNTVMSYDWAGSIKSSYQSLDRQALTYRYGAASELAGVTMRWFAADDILQINGTGRGETLVGVNDDSRIYGGGGNDALVGRAGDDTLDGNAHRDTLNGNNGNDRLLGGDGGDTLLGGGDNDTLNGQNGNDVANGQAGDDLILGAKGNDRLFGESGNDTLAGDAHNDTLEGGSGYDKLFGADGADVMNGGDQNDTLNGGRGPDAMNGDAGNDYVRGGNGADRLIGGAGDDTLKGESQNDTLIGGSGNDVLNGGDWNDILFGSDGQDTLLGAAGNDVLTGETGNDFLWGGIGVDRLYGGNGSDTLVGEARDDTLNGGWGQDLLIGGQGRDFMTGGAHADIFLLERNSGQDRIADFDIFEFDRLMIRDLGISAEQALNRLMVAGQDMVFTWGGVETTLLGNANTAFDTGDFIV